jgi:hypothetical protein
MRLGISMIQEIDRYSLYGVKAALFQREISRISEKTMMNRSIPLQSKWKRGNGVYEQFKMQPRRTGPRIPSHCTE